jgi:hypothetical protein
LGYNGQLREEFRGYVRRILPNTPLSIECEDATFLIRRKRFNKSWEKVTLKSVLEEILRGTGITLETKYLPSITFHGFYLRNVNGAMALQKLKDDFGLTIYFSSFKKLFVGLSYDTPDATVVKYEIGVNTIDNDLERQDSADVQMRVKAIAILPDNSRLETEVGDGAKPDRKDSRRKPPKSPNGGLSNGDFSAEGGGEVRTVHFYNVRTFADLEKLALEELRKFKATSFKGGFTTFLKPFIAVGNVVKLYDPHYPQRGDGDYLVDKVTTTFGTNGGRRKVELGLKVG